MVYHLCFPNCMDCLENTAPDLILAKPPCHRFLPWLSKGKLSFTILGFEMHGANHRVLQWLPLRPLLFDEINPFFSSPFGFWSLVLKKRYHMQRYTFRFVFLVATTSSNATLRHFFPYKSLEIARNVSQIC